MAGFGDTPFGLRQIRLVNIAGTTVVELPIAMTLKFSEKTITGKLRGNDRTQSVVTFADEVSWEISAGGISLEAYALMTGRTVTVTGTTPTRTTTLAMNAAVQFPYFKIYGKALGPNGDDIHVKMVRCKITENGIDGEFKDADFYVTKLVGIAIGDGTDKIVDVVQNETTAALPTS